MIVARIDMIRFFTVFPPYVYLSIRYMKAIMLSATTAGKPP